MNCCPTIDVLLSHLNGEKEFTDLTINELQMIPLEYLIKYVKPLELLNIWYKLPISYKNNFLLQIKLPCFLHYNRPNLNCHFDGPPPSQEKCVLCSRALLLIDV
jgi:hypothetical protein